jgi:L-serine dehydratase
MDEVVQAMMNIADLMSDRLRETALGGLAITPTGLKVREKMGLKPLPKKYLKKCGGCKRCK